MSALILLMIKIQITVTPIKLISSRVYIKQTYKMSSDRCRDPRNGTVIWKKITNIDSFWCNSLLKNASFKKKQMDSGCRRLQHKQLYSSHMLLLLQKGGQRCCTSQSWKKNPVQNCDSKRRLTIPWCTVPCILASQSELNTEQNRQKRIKRGHTMRTISR